MSWTNNITNQIVDTLPSEVEFEGQLVTSDSLTRQQLNSIGWFELKPLSIGGQVLNPQWQ